MITKTKRHSAEVNAQGSTIYMATTTWCVFGLLVFVAVEDL